MITDRYRTLLLVLSMLFASTAAWAGEESQDMPYTILDQRPDRLVVQLPNRMLVAAQEIHTAPVVSAQVTVRTGSIYEQEHVGAGLSHFLEHLLSGGATTHRTEEESKAILGRIGARTNASTGLDAVKYYIDTTSDHTDLIVDLLTDWMQNSIIRQEEYARERDVIQREFESGMGDPGRIFWKYTLQARFQVHPARHPTIGYLDEFLTIQRDEIYDFYRRMYVPNNMIFVVAGDIDSRKVVNQLAALWGTVPAGTLPDLRLPVEAIPSEPRTLVGQAAIRQPKLRLAWPGTRLAGKHDYALDLLSMVLGEGESSRLVRSVRDERQAVSRIDAYNLSFSWGQGFFGVDCDVRPLPAELGKDLAPEQARASAIDRAKAAILEQVAKIRLEGVTEEELARAKRKVVVRSARSNQTSHGIASSLGSDIFQIGDPDYRDHYVEAIEKLTVGHLLAAASEYLDPSRLMTVILEPAAPGQPLAALQRPEDPVLADDVMMEQVVLDNAVQIDRIHALAQSGHEDKPGIEIDAVQRYELPNGLRVVVQRSTLVPAVTMQMYSLGGLLADVPGREGVANAVAGMQMKGTATRTADQISRQVEDLGADFGTSGGNNTTYVQAECLKEDWKTIMELMADVMLRPSFPEEEWARYRPLLTASIARRNDNWHGQLSDSFRIAFFSEQHPWSQSSIGREEIVANLTADDLRQFHRSHLSASQTVLAVFGDVDPAEVSQLADTLFADMPAKAEVAFDPASPPVPEAGIRYIAREQPPAAVQVGFGPGATRRSPDYPALSVLAKVLSDFPSGWLEEELRGAKGDGMAYGVWCYQMTGVVPGSFVIGFNTQPAMVDEALKRTNEIVERARAERVDEETLNRAKTAVLVGEFMAKQSNSSRAAEAALDALYGLGPDESQRFVEEVRNLTPDLLQIVARMYLQNPVTVVLQPASVAVVEEAPLAAETTPAATQPAGE